MTSVRKGICRVLDNFFENNGFQCVTGETISCCRGSSLLNRFLGLVFHNASTLQHQLLNQIWMQINFNIIEFNTYPWIAEDASDPERLLTLLENRCSKLCSCLEQWIPISSDCYILRKPWTYEWCQNLKDNQCMRGCLLDSPFMIWLDKWFCMGRVFEDTDYRVNGLVPFVLTM